MAVFFTQQPEIRQLPNRTAKLLIYQPATQLLPPLPSKAPEPLTRAQVYVLTDTGCASACLSFLDEIMRFPGVTQIGTETHIDRRSGGWPERTPLPSGLARVSMGRMVREGRQRGENEAWVPAIRYRGNIADTEAVKKWVLEEVLPQSPSHH